MVRYARYQIGQGKKSLDASSWQQMSQNASSQQADSDQEDQSEPSAEVTVKKKAVKLRTFSRKGLQSYGTASNFMTSPESSTGIASDLQKLAPAPDAVEVVKDIPKKDPVIKKSSSKKKKLKKSIVEEEVDRIKKSNKVKLRAEDEKELEEVVKKERRREDRRQKRIDERETSKQCFNCRESGHTIANCPKTNKDMDHGTGICFKCGSTEHSVHQCRVKMPPGEYPYAKCFICGDMGHLSNQCVDNPRGLYPNGGCCATCGSVEHYRRDCPEQLKQQGIEDIRLSTYSRSADDDNLLVEEQLPSVRKKGPKLVKF